MCKLSVVPGLVIGYAIMVSIGIAAVLVVLHLAAMLERIP